MAQNLLFDDIGMNAAKGLKIYVFIQCRDLYAIFFQLCSLCLARYRAFFAGP